MLGACALSVLAFFHVQVLSGFTRLSGGMFDGTIEVAILEHWWNVVRGLASWRRTNYFFPAPDTLAYNDGYLIYGLMYAAFRAAGSDPFLGAEGVNVVVKAIGFLGFHAFARRALRLPFGWSLLGAVLFTLSCGSFAQVDHAQLLSVAFAPVAAWLLARTLGALAGRDRWRVLGWGAGTALFCAAWLLTAFYTAWFFAFFLAVAAPFLLARAGRPAVTAAWRSLLFHRAPVAAAALAGLAGLAPFLLVYLPKAAETGMHPFAEVVRYLPSPADLVHVGPYNLLLGWLDRRLHGLFPTEFAPEGEHVAGFAPGLLLLFAGGAWRAWWVRAPAARRRLMRAMTAATAVTWLLTVNVAGHSAWAVVYDLVPGAKAVRVVVRFQLFLAFPVVAVAVWFLAGVGRRVAAPVLVLLAGLLVAEEIATAGPIAIDRPGELRRLEALRPAPAKCRAFFVTGRFERKGEDVSGAAWPYVHNVDAMLIAELTGLPTVNGFSSFNPPGWDFANPDQPDYRARVGRYAAENGIDGLCGLDLPTLRWFAAAPLPPAPPVPLGRDLGTARGQPGSAWLGSGWSAPEPWGTWSDGTVAVLRFGAVAPNNGRWRLTVRARGFVPTPDASQRVEVLVGGQRVATWTVGRRDTDLAAVLPRAAEPGEPLVVRFRIPRPLSPLDADGSPDARRLGLGLLRFRLDAADTR